MKPTIGRIVHYVDMQGQHHGAMIGIIWSETCVNLHVMGGNPKNPVELITSVQLDTNGVQPRSWHWPERE